LNFCLLLFLLQDLTINLLTLLAQVLDALHELIIVVLESCALPVRNEEAGAER
jgi:hypothetical protein